MTGQLLGFLLAFYFLAGRWSFDRLAATEDTGSILSEPRFWIVGSLLPVALLLPPAKNKSMPRGRISAVDIAIIGFLAYMLLAVFWASDADLAVNKAFEVGLLLVVALVVALSRKSLVDDNLQKGFWSTIVAIGFVMATLAIVYSAPGRIHAPGGGPNTLGRNAGLMALGSIYLASKGGASAKVACAGTLLVAILLIMLCGSRGAILSSSVAGLSMLLLMRASITKKFAAALGVTVLATIMIYNTSVGQSAMEMFRNRILQQTLENRYLASRDELWLDAVDWIIERPWFGWGLNGYFANSWTYPHNMILEVTTEGGVVGLCLLLHVGFTCFKEYRRHAFDISSPALAALALTLVAAQSSGDLFDSRGVFLMAALATPSTPWSQKTFERGRRFPRGGIRPCVMPASMGFR